jgi:transposase
MYIDASTYKRNGNTYRRVLLRNSYRVNGKVKHDTIANLSACSDAEIQAIKLALKNKNNLGKLGNVEKDIQTKQGLSAGVVWVLYQLSRQLGLAQALGNTQRSKLALWLVIARVIEQGSRLSATRLAQRHHACDILGLDSFNENDLYDAMDWLASNQNDIENKLFNFQYGEEKPNFYLYDVTSSYFEGEQNELANYGYNRDKKQGKQQIVIGLMTDDYGRPIAIEVFEGNTQDPKTVKSQIKKLAERFGVKDVTLVGDRGMIKQAQIEELNDKDFHYITAITKPQIEKLVKNDVIQLSLFDEQIAEIIAQDIRYILRRNPVRAEEIEQTRQSKLLSLKRFIAKTNHYLHEHPRAKLETALHKIQAKTQQLKMETWLSIQAEGGIISLEIDEEAKKENSKFDGCYVIKTDLACEVATAEHIHARYKELAYVEKAFRTMKTVLLEMRAIYVRKAERTRAHVFVIMLAYLFIDKLQKAWRDVELTVEEGIAELASICSLEIHMRDHAVCQTIPEPRPMGKTLLEKLNITLPKAIPSRKAIVATTKKLVSERN